VQFTSVPVEVVDGLCRAMPGDGLPSYLERGPTPQGASYAVSRVAVQIAGATAGTNEDVVGLSYDDNELTEWRAGGEAATRWARYDFVEPATVSQVVLKPRSWRNVNGAIQLFVGDRAVYEGEIPRSLGYVTFPFEPTRGENLTVALRSMGEAQDAFNIVELSGRRDQSSERSGQQADEPRGDERRSRLGIVEIEIYEEIAN
jgi:hypothetical protein